MIKTMPSDRFTDRPLHDKSTLTMYVVPYIHFEKSGGGWGVVRYMYQEGNNSCDVAN